LKFAQAFWFVDKKKGASLLARPINFAVQKSDNCNFEILQ
jgi:hypothetical protein